MNIVDLKNSPKVAWRNGGGTMQELLAWPSEANWQCRVSVAEVSRDGPFSAYDGFERSFSVMTGAGVRLTVSGVTHELTRNSAPFGFDGGAECTCELIDGATLDFNVICRKGFATGTVRKLTERIQKTLITTKLVAAYAVDTLSTLIINSKIHNLNPGQLAWLELPAGTTLYAAPAPGGQVLLVEVEML
jgi:uncharacterized protein